MLKDVISKLTVLTISEAFLFSLIALCERGRKKGEGGRKETNVSEDSKSMRITVLAEAF